MLRLLLRFLGLCLLAAAFIALLGDATRSVAGSRLYVTPLGEWFTALAPGKVALAQAFAERHVHLFIWDHVMAELMRLPACFAVGAIGCLAIRLGRKPSPRFGYSSR
ncbi:MAG: hypothetical protein ACT4O2_14595 [Beijerinckiaceae bacterium]